jgi:hypothetical protein
MTDGSGDVRSPIVMLGAKMPRIGVYHPIIDLTGAVWFERSGFGVGGC